MTYVELRGADARPMRVQLDDGRWVDGWAEAARRRPDGSWLGFVRYSTGVGETWVTWVDQSRLRSGS